MTDAKGRPPKRLRVCHLAYTFYENDNRVMRYAEALAERDADVDVIALRSPGQQVVGHLSNVRVLRIQRRVVNERSAGAYLLKILCFFIKSTGLLTVMQLRRRYDIVHVHNVPDFLVFAAIIPRLMGARIILDIHDLLPELYADKFGSDRDSTMQRLLLIVERLSCRFAHHVIVANHLWYDKLVRRTVTAGRCTPIINYPDLRVFAPLSKAKRRADGKFLILYPGTLNYHQGVEVAVKAFALVKEQIPGAEFHIYGEGPSRSSVEMLIGSLGLTDRIQLKQRLPLAEIARIMAGADVGVVPKRSDGFGNEAFSTKVLEFMACGVPVIVSRTQVDAHYFNDLLVHFFRPGDEQDLARAFLAVYEHPSHREVCARAARDFAVMNSWQERVGDYLGVIGSQVNAATRSATVTS